MWEALACLSVNWLICHLLSYWELFRYFVYFLKTFSPSWPFQGTLAVHDMAISWTLKYCVRVKLLPEAVCHILHQCSYENKCLSSDFGESTYFISWLKPYSKYGVPSLLCLKSTYYIWWVTDCTSDCKLKGWVYKHVVPGVFWRCLHSTWCWPVLHSGGSGSVLIT